MQNETVKIIIRILITIIVIGGIIFFGYKFMLSNSGVLPKVNSIEDEYTKNEVLDKINFLVKEKYIASYNEAKSNSEKKTEDIYNVDTAIADLVEKNLVEYYYYNEYNEEKHEYKYQIDESDVSNLQKRNDCFYIKSQNINGVYKFGKGNKYTDDGKLNKVDVFLIQKITENDTSKYVLNYYSNGDCEKVGDLNIEKPLE